MRFKTIIHPTDFSDTSIEAFLHALRIALATRSKLYLIHVAQYGEEEDGFPHIRHALAQWKLINEDDPPTAVGEKLGIKVAKVGLEPQNVLRGLLRFLDSHPSDLVVLATHGRDGINRWLHGSIAEEMSRSIKLPSLFIAPGARGFVDQFSGQVRLARVLVPVDLSPQPALAAIEEFVRTLNGRDAAIELMHVGASAPPIWRDGANVSITLHSGDVVGSIMNAAQQVDLVAMTTAGHHGFLDALRGSTTERVLRHAPCPVLAMSAEQIDRW
jgi:nucleotide-binding universal stress UspA family protein